MALAYPRIDTLVSRRCLVNTVSVEFEQCRDWLPEDDHEEGDHQPCKKATDASKNLEAINDISSTPYLVVYLDNAAGMLIYTLE